jgi:P-type Cu2+ transporter
MATQTQKVVKQNLAWALLYNAVIIPLAAKGLIPPYLAAVGMSLSSLIVLLNSLRLNRDKVITSIDINTQPLLTSIPTSQ